ncbi:MAG: hypothetical protein QG597_3448, partial [Actinomycetota bacterium]|nr:hypothetical protein [Actinomycetota bacterium]
IRDIAVLIIDSDARPAGSFGATLSARGTRGDRQAGCAAGNLSAPRRCRWGGPHITGWSESDNAGHPARRGIAMKTNAVIATSGGEWWALAAPRSASKRPNHSTLLCATLARMMRTLDTDYLVIGAGAMGMAFTDALIDHADVHVTMVDRRHGPGGHWLDAYPFVRLHQASTFYGVASTVIGGGAIQQYGPEEGLHERAGRAQIQAYYEAIMERRFLGSGRVNFLSGSDHHLEGTAHVVTSRVSGERLQVDVRRRVVDAAYLAPVIPALTPPPFAVGEGVRVATINELTTLESAPSSYVIVGSGKTATDAIVWLLGNGLDPDRIVWVRPRDAWMLNRAVIQPDPAVYTGVTADTFEAAAESQTIEEVFLRLEDAGVMIRVDRAVAPTMARAPTLGGWELELLRSVEHVVRLGHIRAANKGHLVLDGGVVPIPEDALVVHCAGKGLTNPPMVPIWGPELIRLQSIRAGFPCFGGALAGYVEATRDDDRERNRLCPPNIFGDTLADWAQMQYRGSKAVATFGAEPDIAAWANACHLNPSAIPPAQRDQPAVQAARARIAGSYERGLLRLAIYARESSRQDPGSPSG